jgi:hypothetical protein
MSAGTYPIYVINPDGGTAISIPGISYSGVPAFATTSGSLGTVYEGATFGSTIAATSDSAVTYTIDSGALPAGFSLNANTGAIAGNVGTITDSTTYNFTIKATDAELQDTTRNFSITTSPDVVTFNTPAGNQTYSNLTSESFSLTLNATSVLGRTISYTANALPTGLTLSGNVISGTFSSVSSVASLITATAATSLKTATRLLTWTIASPPMAEIELLIVAGGGYGTSGGGGAGGLVYYGSNSTPKTPNGNAYQLVTGTYTIVVGAGSASSSTQVGGTSSFSLSGTTLFSATGGGAGGNDSASGTASNDSLASGKNGGSGGGAGLGLIGGYSYGFNPGQGIVGQGRPGGYNNYDNNNPKYGAGGGGGAGADGGGGVASWAAMGGAGGSGLTYDISGSAVTYAGGGGGRGYARQVGVNGQGGSGGSGGGGRGYGDTGPTYTAGEANTGGGGGGGGQPGGSGIVIIRYADTFAAASATTGSPTITVAGGYRVYKFTSSGSITF